MSQKTFADYKSDGANWITLASGEFYPDILEGAKELYKPVLVMFGQLLKASESSTRLLLLISEVPDGWMRIQLLRVFRKYVSPDLPVEMLKKKRRAQQIGEQFGKGFRPIHQVQAAFSSRPIPDEALCAILWEYKGRGKKGYDLTARFFEMFRTALPNLTIQGPERAGKDILMGTIFADYPKPDRPVDFVLFDGEQVMAIGLARYDSDRGGAQEDDRTGGYQNTANELLNYAASAGLNYKVIFLNDGPGLLLGSMWDDYAYLERNWPGRVLVTTLWMVPERLTLDWIKTEG